MTAAAIGVPSERLKHSASNGGWAGSSGMALAEVAASGQPSVVLLIDESPAVRNELARALRSPNLEVLTTGEPEAGLAVLDRQRVDILIVDQGLSSVRGSELLECARQRHPEVKRVLLTGRGDFTSLSRAVNRSGVSFFLSKPWERSSLHDFVENLLADPAPAGHGDSQRGRPLSVALRPKSASGLRVADRPDWNDVVDSMNLPALVIDANHRVLSANRAARVSLGVVVGEPTPTCCGALCAGADDPDCAVSEAIASRAEVVRDWSEACNGGNAAPRYFEVATHPYAGPDSRRVLQLVRDVTDARDRRHRELHTLQLAAAGKVAAAVAHEIRNPLAAMTNAVSLLRTAPDLGEDGSELIDIILEESRRASRIVGDYLSAVRHAPAGVSHGQVDVADIIAGAVMLIEKDPRFPEGARLQVEIEAALPSVSADRDRVCEVIWNLALNALQAIGQRGRVVVAARRRVRNGRGGVELCVDDDGPGIEPERRERVLAPFETSKPNGTGLGLSLSKQIVDAHAGVLEISDSELGGARVLVWLASEDSSDEMGRNGGQGSSRRR